MTTSVRGQPLTGAPAITLDVYLNPDVANVVDQATLYSLITADIQSALGPDTRVIINATDQPFGDAFVTSVIALDSSIGYGTARDQEAQAYAQWVNANQDSASYQALAAAAQASQAAAATLEAAAAANSPLILTGSDHIGVDVMPSLLYGATHDFSERWFVANAGMAMALYPPQSAPLEQSIANAVVQGVGLVAGLSRRAGGVGEAMTTASGLDVEASDNVARDAAPVTLSDAERSQVRGRFTPIGEGEL